MRLVGSGSPVPGEIDHAYTPKSTLSLRLTNDGGGTRGVSSPRSPHSPCQAASHSTSEAHRNWPRNLVQVSKLRGQFRCATRHLREAAPTMGELSVVEAGNRVAMHLHAKWSISQSVVGLGGVLHPLPRKGEGRRHSGGEGLPQSCNSTTISETEH
jgi:hypothetical protein